jgi:hypothetical protein
MKYIYLLCAVLVLSACGNTKHSHLTSSFKLKRAQPTEQRSNEQRTLASAEPAHEKQLISETPEHEQPAVVAVQPAINAVAPAEKEIITRPNAIFPDLAAIDNTPLPEDSLENVREAQEKYDIATKAEKNGKRGKVFGLLSLITMLTFVFGFLTIPFAIAGLVNSAIALRAPYITDKGLKDARAGLVMSVLSLAITILLVILLVLIILALV